MEAPTGTENPPQQENNEEQQQQQQPIETNDNAQPIEQQQEEQTLDENSQTVDATSNSMIGNDSEQQTMPGADQAVIEEDTAHKQDEATPMANPESETQPANDGPKTQEQTDTATPMDEDTSRKATDNTSSNEQQNEMDHNMSDAEPLQQQQDSQSSSTPVTSTPPTTQSSATTSSTSAPTAPPPSFISEPASWQIPPSALQANNTSSPGLHAASPASNAYNNSHMDATPDPAANKAQAKRERLEQRIAKSQYDSNAWLALINEIQQTGDLEATRDVYERFLEVFPTAVSSMDFSLYQLVGHLHLFHWHPYGINAISIFHTLSHCLSHTNTHSLFHMTHSRSVCLGGKAIGYLDWDCIDVTYGQMDLMTPPFLFLFFPWDG